MIGGGRILVDCSAMRMLAASAVGIDNEYIEKSMLQVWPVEVSVEVTTAGEFTASVHSPSSVKRNSAGMRVAAATCCLSSELADAHVEAQVAWRLRDRLGRNQLCGAGLGAH